VPRDSSIKVKRPQDARLIIIGRPSFDSGAFYELLNTFGETWSPTVSATAAENLVEVAGRLCYMSFGARQSPKTNREYITNLVQQGHESVLEHVSWSFVLAGVTRAFTHQFVRHRVGFSFSQLSQQYRDHSNAAVVEPIRVSADPLLSARWRSAMNTAMASYRELLQQMHVGIDGSNGAGKRELQRSLRSAARSVLPEAIETTVAFTANARAIRHFLKIRGSVEGDDEMRIVSSLLLSAVQMEAPSLFADFVSDELNGLPIVRHRPSVVAIIGTTSS
jgi:thymidylate synthase (FAD)